MFTDTTLGWMALLGLGAIHGLNPAMGWLFAVGIGLQEQSSRAIWRALGPLAAGHALAVGAAVGIAMAVGLVVPPRLVRWMVGGLLVVLGCFQLVRHRHPGWGGMRMRGRELAMWSFLMASAHGSGLMVLPVFLGASSRAGISDPSAGRAGHLGGSHHAVDAAAIHLGVASVDMSGLIATMVHSAGYLIVTAALAVLVYERLGLRLLRSAWINLDLFWAMTLVAVGAINLMI